MSDNPTNRGTLVQQKNKDKQNKQDGNKENNVTSNVRRLIKYWQGGGKKQTEQQKKKQTGPQTKQQGQKQTGKLQQTKQQGQKQTGKLQQTKQQQTKLPQTGQKQTGKLQQTKQQGQKQTIKQGQKQTGKLQQTKAQTGQPQAGQQQNKRKQEIKTLIKDLKNLFFIRRTQEEKKTVKNILEHIKVKGPTNEQIEQINEVLKSKDRRFPKVSKLLLGGQTIYQMYPTYEKFLQQQK
mgnify:CR=1 FL=1